MSCFTDNTWLGSGNYKHSVVWRWWWWWWWWWWSRWWWWWWRWWWYWWMRMRMKILWCWCWYEADGDDDDDDLCSLKCITPTFIHYIAYIYNVTINHSLYILLGDIINLLPVSISRLIRWWLMSSKYMPWEFRLTGSSSSYDRYHEIIVLIWMHLSHGILIDTNLPIMSSAHSHIFYLYIIIISYLYHFISIYIYTDELYDI